MRLLVLLVGVRAILSGVIFLVIKFIRGEFEDEGGAGRAFECGFEPLGESRVGLSMRFFILVRLFLIFDVEVVLILPLVLNEVAAGWFYFGFVVIFIILVGGLGYEWEEGRLRWVR